MLEDGARRPPSYYGLHCLALFAGDVSCYFLVGQGPPRPVLHDEKIYWGAGGRGTETTVLLWLALLGVFSFEKLIHC